MENVKYIAHRRQKDGLEQSLEAHLTEVAKLTGKFADKINASDAGELIGLLHDFGKYSADFQNYIGSATGKINPEIIPLANNIKKLANKNSKYFFLKYILTEMIINNGQII